jgi:hypothetical protein
MQPVASGALLFSAWVDQTLQRPHCRVKESPYSQAVLQVCDFIFKVYSGARCVFCDGERGAGVCVGMKKARFEPPLRLLMPSCRKRWFQRCGHFQCNQWPVEHCCSQRGSIQPCSDLTAESRNRHIRRRFCRFVIFYSGFIVGRVAYFVTGGRGAGVCIGMKKARFEPPLRLLMPSCSKRCFQRCGHFRRPVHVHIMLTRPDTFVHKGTLF